MYRGVGFVGDVFVCVDEVLCEYVVWIGVLVVDLVD